MKKYTIQFAILLATLILSQTAFADIKIKSRQTVSGQTYENSTYIKGKRSRSESMDGKMIMITQCDLKRDLQMMPESKMYMVKPFDDVVVTTTTAKTAAAPQTNGAAVKGGTVKTIITTKDTGERKQMFGYTARHLIITIENESSPDACQKNKTKMVQDGWYIDAAFQMDCERSTSYGGYSGADKPGCQDKYEVKQVGTAKRGYPVYEKMTIFDENGTESVSIINEVIELSKATLSADLFDIPADYREVKDQSQLYASMSGGSANNSISTDSYSNGGNNSGISQNIKNMAKNESAATQTTLGAKKEGVVRIGLAGVKTIAAGEGLNPAELSAAIQNTLSEYLKSPQLEIVALEAKLPSAIDAEAKQKECDFVIYAQVSHKKGGGGMFGKVLGKMGETVARNAYGSSNVAGHVAQVTIMSAASVSGNVKSKDEIAIDIKMASATGSTVLTKQYKGKAKSDGEDIITPLIEQAAQSIVDSVNRK